MNKKRNLEFKMTHVISLFYLYFVIVFIRPLDLPPFENGLQCELKGYKLGGALKEQLRPPRIVRVAVIQNSLVLPTTAPIQDQRAALHDKITKYIEHAAACGVNIICMQELWSKYDNFLYILSTLNC